VTVKAKPASNVERQYHAVTLFYAVDGFTDFVDDSHDFVPYNGSFLERSATVIHMQIAATNSTRGNPQ
jgi:hypothetical protein